MTDVTAFHAHVYFDKTSREQARALCEAARERFGIEMGRMHEGPVGPHPAPSCQLAFPPEKFGEVVPWLALNRGPLAILVHPETGNALADHTAHALWMGEIKPLDTSIFEKG
ncbi:MAG: DOPA 4,5-dioxygenase family protein [Methyloligellaceae bacterium]|nr:MAG: 4,5-dioxygenase [Alphaproteobacteria bacterium]